MYLLQKIIVVKSPPSLASTTPFVVVTTSSPTITSSTSSSFVQWRCLCQLIGGLGMIYNMIIGFSFSIQWTFLDGICIVFIDCKPFWFRIVQVIPAIIKTMIRSSLTYITIHIRFYYFNILFKNILRNYMYLSHVLPCRNWCTISDSFGEIIEVNSFVVGLIYL